MTEPAPAPAPTTSRPPRSLAEDLSQRSDAALRELFRQRPDLARPLPEQFAALAIGVCFPPSLRLAWLKLTRLEQQVLEVLLALARPTPLRQVVHAMDPDAPEDSAAAITQALHRCRDMALIWGGDDGLRPVTGMGGQAGPYPCGLDPEDRSHLRRIALYQEDPAALLDELATAPPGARAALDRLLWGPPRGGLPNAERPVSAASAATPVEWLLARDLLVPTGPDTVALPREVALLLRGGRYVRSVALPPGPPVDPAAGKVPDADATAGMNALQCTRAAARLLSVVDEGNTRALRSGGVYQRDAAELARRLHADLPTTALLVETAAAAGLIAADEEAGTWRLTRVVDTWRALPEARQWTALVLAWRDHAVAEALIALPGGQRQIASDALVAPGPAQVRQLALRAAAAAPAGRVVDGQRLSEAMAWYQPRLDGADLPEAVRELLGQMEYLGILGRSALGRAGRRLARADAEPEDIAAAVVWPALVDRVVLQADLTATALGPLTPEAQSRLERLADLESAGAGAVYRISAATLQRALDAGMATAEVLAELADLSATGMPATLETLVCDVGRRHGTIRVAAAASVITSDDDAVLSAALADRSLQHLRLHRVAAGVAISALSPDEVATALRKAGLPALSPSGVAPRPRRLPAPRPVRTDAPSEEDFAVAVRGLRAGEAARRSLIGPSTLASPGPHDLVAMLQEAIREESTVWVDFADPTGTRRLRAVQPLTLRAGVLSAFDTRDRRVAAFPLSRIAGIAVADASGPGAAPGQT